MFKLKSQKCMKGRREGFLEFHSTTLPYCLDAKMIPLNFTTIFWCQRDDDLSDTRLLGNHTQKCDCFYQSQTHNFTLMCTSQCTEVGFYKRNTNMNTRRSYESAPVLSFCVKWCSHFDVGIESTVLHSISLPKDKCSLRSVFIDIFDR